MLFKKNVTAPTPLEVLQQRSANAVSLIRTTIDQLKETNNAIAVERANNDAMISALSATNASLDGLKGENEKIIANFEGLLS